MAASGKSSPYRRARTKQQQPSEGQGAFQKMLDQSHPPPKKDSTVGAPSSTASTKEMKDMKQSKLFQKFLQK